MSCVCQLFNKEYMMMMMMRLHRHAIQIHVYFTLLTSYELQCATHGKFYFAYLLTGMRGQP